MNFSCRSRSAVPCFALESQCRGRDFLRVRPQDVCFSGRYVISTRLLQEVYSTLTKYYANEQIRFLGIKDEDICATADNPLSFPESK